MRRLVLVLALAGAAGCAHKRAPAPTAAIPQPPPPTRSGVVKKDEPPPPASSQPISAPWDTAGSASARAARRNHVYPKGPTALGQKLVDSLPDPAAMMPGATNDEAATKYEPPKAAPPPVSDSQCWEVQVLVTTNQDKARQEVRNIDRELNLAAWVRENGGMYRVRVGGCLTADGASELAQRLKEQGYPEAFRTMREP